MRLTQFGFHGVIFYVVMSGAFFASPYSNLFFLLLAFLTLQWFVCIVGTRRNLAGVSAVFEDVAPVPSGREVEVAAALKSPRRARFQVAVQVELEGGGCLEGQVDLLETRAPVKLTAPGLARGKYSVRRTLLVSAHPFGLLRFRRTVEGPDSLIVYPAPKSLMEGRSAAEALDELLGRENRGPGDLQPASLRDHRDGDGVRSIHWRASARRGRLVVQEWEGASGQGLEVSLDRRCDAADLEDALATISAMVHLARTNKETLTLHSQDVSATYGTGHRPWAEVLTFLASAQVLSSDQAAPPTTSPSVARLPRVLSHA